MGTIREDVFLGTTEKYNQKLDMLVKMAQPEKWTYKRIQDSDPYRILRNYIQFTYNRIDEENKFIPSADSKFRCMNTGLLTVYNQEINAIFAKNEMEIAILRRLYANLRISARLFLDFLAGDLSSRNVSSST
jgi:hypothetical protein